MSEASVCGTGVFIYFIYRRQRQEADGDAPNFCFICFITLTPPIYWKPCFGCRKEEEVTRSPKGLNRVGGYKLFCAWGPRPTEKKNNRNKNRNKNKNKESLCVVPSPKSRYPTPGARGRFWLSRPSRCSSSISNSGTASLLASRTSCRDDMVP